MSVLVTLFLCGKCYAVITCVFRAVRRRRNADEFGANVWNERVRLFFRFGVGLINFFLIFF